MKKSGALNHSEVSKQYLDSLSLPQHWAHSNDCLGAEGIAQKLKTDIRTGLKGGSDFTSRTEAFGNNERDEVEAKSFCSIFIEALDDFMMKILLVAATGSMIFGYIGAKPEDYGHGK